MPLDLITLAVAAIYGAAVGLVAMKIAPLKNPMLLGAVAAASGTLVLSYLPI